MTAEQQGVSPASAGGASAPDFNAIRDAVIDSFRAVPLWQFRQGLVTAGLIPADVEITAADRKPVHSEPGIDADWDEDANAMLVHGVGWDLSWGCKVSFAYDHDKGEHYVCVSTSDADQRAGITTRRATKEQLASLGQQLLNVFGEPDPRDAEIEQLRGTLQEIADLVAADATRPDSVRSAVENWLFELDQRHGERDEARMEWKRADAEVTRLKRLVGNENVSYDGWDQLSCHDAIVRCEEGWQEYLKARDERDRLRQQLDQHLADETSAQAANDRLRTALTNAEADRDIAQANERDLRRRLNRIAQETSFESALDAEPENGHTVACGAGNEDYSELSCTLTSGHGGEHQDRTQGATWPVEMAVDTKARA